MAAEQDDSLQKMLGQLRQAGTVDSSGSFTLDLDKSLDKLAHFQIEDPRRYVDFLVAAAYAKGATFLQFEVGVREVVACSDGQPFAHSEMVNLFQTLFESQAQLEARAAHYLAFALNVTRQIGAQFVIFDSYGEDGGTRLQLTSGLLQVARLAKRPWDDPRIVNRFHMREPIDPDLMGRIAEGVLRRLASQHFWPEHDYLAHQRCGFAPLQIWLNGKLIRPPLGAFLECWAEKGKPLRPGGLPLSVPIKDNNCSGGVGLRQDCNGSVYWIVDGIGYQETMERVLPKEIVFWFYCDELRTDVSHVSLIQGPELARRREMLHEMLPPILGRLQAEVRENPMAMEKYRGFGRAVLF